MIDSHELRRRDGTPRHDQRTADAIRIISELRFLFECNNYNDTKKNHATIVKLIATLKRATKTTV